ncbi:DUF3592 domain-containing protein [Parasulfitobacter algicola]|uniref:DUF3592 domain-containing protein n=1 Tax=Parasulfitobacter algicola TaxID=2614809 RepID=A0ABX2IT55_9RHOB|nr:DUF3592 domain-containing protein [Sulfitobacter algicola]NSX56097.1 DUF3592 domain-containing protein [Sulfitobacter algicola]
MAGDGPALAKLATAWFLFFTVKYHLDLRKIATWPSTIGKLNEFKYLDASNHNDPLKMIAYSYEVDGTPYKGGNTNLAHIRIGGPSSGSRIKKMMRRVQRIDDDKVVVFYNPSKPKKSLLLKPSSTEYGFLILLYLTTLGVAYLGFFHAG